MVEMTMMSQPLQEEPEQWMCVYEVGEVYSVQKSITSCCIWTPGQTHGTLFVTLTSVRICIQPPLNGRIVQ